MISWNKQKTLRYFLYSAALLTLVTYLYYPSLEYAFLDGWDDPQYITENSKIRSLSFDNIVRIFTSFDVGNYAPLHILSYALEFQYWGLDPFGYRLTNVALHLLNAFLVFFIVRKISEREIIALSVALLFAVHPLQVETVVWISQRKTLLSALFMFISFLFFLKYRDDERPVSFSISLVFYIMALLSKISIIVLPIYMLAYDFLVAKQVTRKRLIQDYLMFACVSIVMVPITLMSQGLGVGIRTSHYGSGVLEWLSVPPALWASYVQLISWPAGLSALYDEHVVLQSVEIKALAAVFALGGVVTYLARKNTPVSRKLLFWIVWFIAGFLPVSHIIPMVTVMNDRYVYFPMIGLTAFLTTVVYETAFNKRERTQTLLLAAGTLVLLSAAGMYAWMTEARIPTWENSYTLWNDAVQKYPGQATARNNLGAAFEVQGDLYEAKLHYRKALEIHPDLFVARYNLGKVYGQQKKFDKAAQEFRKAAAILPMDPKIHYYAGLAYKMDGQRELAIDEFRKDLEITPGNLSSVKELLALYIASGQRQEARTLTTETRKRFGRQHPVEQFLKSMEQKIGTDSGMDGS